MTRGKKLVWFLALLGSSCAHHGRQTMKIAWTDSVKFDQDQTVICFYIAKRDSLLCMSPEEFQVRWNAADDGK